MTIARLAIGVSAMALLSGVAFGSSCPLHLVTIEPDGQAAEGSKETLRTAVRAGLPLRVGWSLSFDEDAEPEVRHWSDGGLLTEFEGEIFAQLDDIQAQGPRLGRAACALPSWRLVYQHDTSGAAIEGTKAALFDAVRRGYPIRFAWGAAAGTPEKPVSVEHAAEPVFISLMGESELFVQLPEHIAQASYNEPAKAAFGKPAVMWRGMMGTNGSFDAVMVDRASGKEVWRMPQRARIAWFAYAPEPLCARAPVKLAVRDGVVRDGEARR